MRANRHYYDNNAAVLSIATMSLSVLRICIFFAFAVGTLNPRLCAAGGGALDSAPAQAALHKAAAKIAVQQSFVPAPSAGSAQSAPAKLGGDGLAKQTLVQEGRDHRKPMFISSSSIINFFSLKGTDSCHDDLTCITMSVNDRQGLEAIKSLHSQLDDDANGNIDLSESDDFLREELQYEAGYEKRQRVFHHNDDMHISVRELWDAWVKSEVHNWTIEQTSEWLTSSVELPQYVPTFIQHRVTGATLPRLAVNNNYYVSNVLGIKDPIHKQKIALKAMDVVLFGPPKDTGHSLKDLILLSCLFGALVGCWFAFQQKKSSQKDLHRMIKDMESLHKADLELKRLQKEFEIVKLEQESVTTEKRNLEKRLKDESMAMNSSTSDLQVSQLKAEIQELKMELQRAEGELEDRLYSPPHGLQHWLQLTHEIENKSYMKKKQIAEKQLQTAREACEKLKKKRSSLVGAFVSTHGKSIDEVDKSIVEARTALNEVTAELQERVHRWKQIELLCGFNIINNNGMNYLENLLYRGGSNGRSVGMKGRHNSQDDLDDDLSSLYSPSLSGAAGLSENLIWKESSNPPDSSGSEAGSKDTPTESSTNVQFTLGGDSIPDNEQQQSQSMPPQPSASVSARVSDERSTSMIRSYSQEANMTTGVNEEPFRAINKSSHSDNSLMEQHHHAHKQQQQQQQQDNRMSSRLASLKKPFRELSTVVSLDEETLSTDSGSTADPLSTSSQLDEATKKRKSRKIFPAFGKKSNKANKTES
ncbi:hypothetical protein TKK_0012898 [Trichogramma kaykai]|uniref:SAM domain-containing protein n=1 Tax=Trichogramma kaykai TaxID=54128 RepID=A0ABD2WLT1_9HYME